MTTRWSELEPVPPGRTCAGCGGEVRFSHVAYVGRGESVAVHRCRGCGRGYRGATRDGGTAQAVRPDRRRGGRRPLPDEGAPDNPVLDESTARRLREALGGEDPSGIP